jgi:uncharacterized RDD family membrane protein YckC
MTALRDETAPASVPQPGLVTRTVAFAIDAALINAGALVCGAIVALCVSLVSVSDTVAAVLAAAGAVAFVLWSGGYFVAFWSTTGQTPGGRVMAVRVCDARDGQPVSAVRAVVRLIGILAAAVPFFAGFLPILVDPRRRGLQDMLAGTVVVDASGRWGGRPARAATPATPSTPERPEARLARRAAGTAGAPAAAPAPVTVALTADAGAAAKNPGRAG